MSDSNTIGGMSREEIPVPRLHATTCVECEEVKRFDVSHNTDSGVAFECATCGHVVELDLNPQQ